VCEREIPLRLCHPIPEAAWHLGISRSGLFVKLKNGEIASRLIGGRRVIRHQDLIDFIERQPTNESVAWLRPQTTLTEAAHAAAIPASRA
jgi:hypothetical protein